MMLLNEIRTHLKVLGFSTKYYPVGNDLSLIWRMELTDGSNGYYYDFGDPEHKNDDYVAQYLLIMYIKAVKAQLSVKAELGVKAVGELEKLSVGALMSTKRGGENG